MQQDNPLEFKTEDPEIKDLQEQARIFLELCVEVEKIIREVELPPTALENTPIKEGSLKDSEEN